jgi:SAM-dependent methyltransferase
MFAQTHPPSSAAAAASQGPATRLCCACGSITEHDFRFHVNGWRIFQCRLCGTGCTDAHGFDPALYYTEDYFCGGHADGYSDYLGSEEVLRPEFARSVDFIRRYRPGGRLLEIGCAYGFFLMEARGHFDVIGLELATEAADHARDAGLHVLQGEPDEKTLREIGNVDVIVMLDVIEHLPDPRQTLALCRRYINPGGIIVITTGDFGSVLARSAGKKWRLMTPPQHLWFFTGEGMRRLATGAGFSMPHFDRPWKIVPASLALFQLQRILHVPVPRLAATSRFGIPINLFDAMRVVLQKPW